MKARRNNYKLSLSWVVSLAFVFVVTLCGGVILLLSVQTNFKTTRSFIEKASIASTEAIEKELYSLFYPAFTGLSSVKELAEMQETPEAALAQAKSTFQGLLFGLVGIETVVVSTPDGHSWGLKRRPDQVTVSEFRPDNSQFKFTRLLASQLEHKMNPYLGEFYKTREGVFVNISASIVIMNKTVAILTIVLPMSAVGDTLANVTQDAGVTRFLLQENLEVIAYSSSYNNLAKTNLLKPVSEFGDPVLKQILTVPSENLGEKSREKGVTVYVLEGRGEENYLLVLQEQVSPEGDVYYVGEYQLAFSRYDELKRLFTSVIAGIAVVIISAIVALFLARRIASPLKAIAGEAEKIGSFRFDQYEMLASSHIREIDQITQTMNRGASGLQVMSRYIPRSFFRKLFALGFDRAAKAREEELTILFTDIAGFTSLSEHKSASEIADLLNNHFKLLVKAVEAHQGTVDKFIGDGMLAFWGAPDKIEDHATKALEAARDMMAAIHQMNSQTPENALKVRFALHTGTVIVGNVGAIERWNYTVVGDTVNVCSRLQSLAGTIAPDAEACVLVTRETFEKAGKPEDLMYCGSYEIRGRKAKVEVWQLEAND